jgi:RHS repeat-associated protein
MNGSSTGVFYSYYDDGSLKDVKTPEGVLVVSYTYHPDGSLDTITYLDGTMTNTWDAIGNRVGITVNGAAYSFIYDPTAGVPAVLEENRPGGVVVRYYRTPDGALIARKKGTDWSYYHYDELGSTVLLTDGAGNVTDRYTYDPWGNIASHIGSTNDNPYLYIGALGYYTHYQDSEFGLLHLGFRFYNPKIGRFTQLDPIKDGLNWYAYCDGNPLTSVDPWGLSDYLVTQYSPVFKMVTNAMLILLYAKERGVVNSYCDLINNDKLWYNFDLDKEGLTTRTNHVVLGAGVIQSIDSGIYQQMLKRNMDTFEYDLWAASVMIHEYTHSQQSATQRNYGRRNAEFMAYEAQIVFLERVYANLKRDHADKGKFTALDNIYNNLLDCAHEQLTDYYYKKLRVPIFAK